MMELKKLQGRVVHYMYTVQYIYYLVHCGLAWRGCCHQSHNVIESTHHPLPLMLDG